MQSTRQRLWAFLAPTPLTSRPAGKPKRAICTRMSAREARTAAITGASGGIGLETAKGLIRTLPHLSHLYLLCRNVEKAEAAAEPLRNGMVAGRKVQVSVLPVELADGKSVVKCAEDLKGRLGELDLLVCNAGIMASPLMFSEDEVEMQYAVNHLSHALLTYRLMPVLKGRVVFVSSMAVAIVQDRTSAPVIAERTEGVLNEGNYKRWQMYGDSKLAMSLFARAVAQKEEIDAVSLHPGVVATDLGRYIVPGVLQQGWVGKSVTRVLGLGLKTPEEGARLSVHLSGMEGGGEGKMFVDVGREVGRAAPLLEVQGEVERCYEDTMRFVRSF